MLGPKKIFSTLHLLGFSSPGIENGMAQKVRLDRAREGAGDRDDFGGGLGKEESVTP